MTDPHEDCALCDLCGRHLHPFDQWPCLTCHRMLCAICECPVIHTEETPC